MGGNYTIKDKYKKYKNKELLIYNESIKIYFTVVGYVEDTHTLIGVLRKNTGMNCHFRKPKKCAFVENETGLDEYIYVPIQSVESYPNLKKLVKRKTYKELDEIDFKI